MRKGFLQFLGLVLLLLACSAAYQETFDAGFVWDDRLILLENPNVRGFSAENLRWMCTEHFMGHWHPLTWASLAWDFTRGGLDPAGYHLVNVFMHGLNSGLVFLLAQVIAAQLFPAWTARRRYWFGVFVGLLFALHPLRVESVAWVTERRDVLSVLLLLPSFLFWHRYVTGTSAARTWYLASLLCFLLSLLSKAWGITFPAVLVLLDYAYFQRSRGVSWRGEIHRRLLLEKLPFFLLALLCAIRAYYAQKAAAMDMVEDHHLFDRIVQAGYGLLFYLQKTILPLHLSPLYLIKDDYDPLAWPYGPYALISFALLGLLVYRLVRSAERVKPWLAVVGSYALTISPVLGLAQSGQQLAADRYTYLACLPLLLGGAAFLFQRAVAWEARFPAWRRLLVLATALPTGAVAATLGWLTYQQSKIWRDEIALWQHAIAIDPENPVAHNNLGLALEDRRRWDQAFEHYGTAVRLSPGYAAALYNRANMLSQRGKRAEALADYDRALRRDPKMIKAWNNRGNLHRDLGDLPASLADLTQAVTIHPRYADAFYNRGLTYKAMNDDENALADYTRAIEINPSFAQAYNNRANLYRQRGQPELALQDYARAIAANPFYFNARFNRGNLHKEAERWAEALADYQAAQQLQPGYGPAFGNAGVCLWKLGRHQEAERSFLLALQKQPSDQATRFNLAQFYRHLGYPQNALQHLQIVLQNTPPTDSLYALARQICAELRPEACSNTPR